MAGQRLYNVLCFAPVLDSIILQIVDVRGVVYDSGILLSFFAVPPCAFAESFRPRACSTVVQCCGAQDAPITRF